MEKYTVKLKWKVVKNGQANTIFNKKISPQILLEIFIFYFFIL